MELHHIPIENIHDTKLNMRHDRRPPDVSDILPTVWAKGILQPLLVRPYTEVGDHAFEISYSDGHSGVAEAARCAEHFLFGSRMPEGQR